MCDNDKYQFDSKLLIVTRDTNETSARGPRLSVLSGTLLALARTGPTVETWLLCHIIYN